jgi:alanine dehydrogenase
MIIGIPKESSIEEHRVALTPAGVYALAKAGHTVVIEEDAGADCCFTDEAYYVVGGKIVSSASEVFGEADAVAKVLPPSDDEYALLRPGQILFSFYQLGMRTPAQLQQLLEKKIAAIGTESIRTEHGAYPMLMAMSEIAGPMLPQIAGRYLEVQNGGAGITLAGGPGIPPANVVILGAGTLGTAAARAFCGLGAQVYVFDRTLPKLRRIDELFSRRAVTLLANPFEIERMAQLADVLIGAIHVPGEPTTKLVSAEMVSDMKDGAVIIDAAIDQGGCVETSRPTTHSAPVFVERGVIHYCVPNIPASVARTASHAVNNVLLEYVLEVANLGLEGALQNNSSLASGVLTFQGHCVHAGLGQAMGVKVGKLEKLL